MREMKDSGVAWIGEIPKDWDLSRLKFSSTYNDESIKEDTNPEKEIEYVEIGSVTLENGVEKAEVMRFKDAPSRARRIARKGDIIISTVRTYLKAIALIEKESYTVSTGFCVIRPQKCMDSGYLKYFCSSELFTSEVSACSVGISYPAINASTLMDFHIINPPLAVQHKIVRVLDEKCNHVDSLIANVQAQIEKLKTYKQSLITEVVTKGLDPNAPMKDSGIEWIGKIPDSWNVSRIKYISDFGPTCDASKLTNDSIITYTPMECIKNGYFEPRSANYGALSHSLTAFQDGDIVLAKVTPCFENGNIAIMSDLDSNYGLGSSELFVLRPRTIHTRYFFYWLQNRYFLERGRATMTGTGGLKRVSPTFVKGCYIHIPPRPEQEKIADVLDTKCAQINRFISLKESKIEKLQQYKRSLIYEYVTGKKEVV